jgi:membrane protease YdiL (CAAX protease family)
VLGLAATAATVTVVITVVWPRSQISLVRILTVTVFIYLIFRPLAMPWSYWLSTLPFTSTEQFWIVRGPGGAIFGLLPSVVCVLLGGRFLFRMSIQEQCGGRLRPCLRDLLHGGGAAVAPSAFFLCGAAATGNGRIAWEPNWAGHGANLFSNLCEELLARGLLLRISRREGGKWFAIVWTSIVFGSMHPFGWFALGIATTAWILAWVILRSGSLWAGDIMHQGLDFVMDSLLH